MRTTAQRIFGRRHSTLQSHGLFALAKHLLALTVANLALHKESFVSNRRQYKRHVRNQWTHGQASRAVDGDLQASLHSCTLLDNFYVDKPVWMVDLGSRTVVSGVVIVTWQASEHQHNGKLHLAPRDVNRTEPEPNYNPQFSKNRTELELRYRENEKNPNRTEPPWSHHNHNRTEVLQAYSM